MEEQRTHPPVLGERAAVRSAAGWVAGWVPGAGAALEVGPAAQPRVVVAAARRVGPVVARPASQSSTPATASPATGGHPASREERRACCRCRLA